MQEMFYINVVLHTIFWDNLHEDNVFSNNIPFGKTKGIL